MFTYTYANNLKKISDESHSHIERKKWRECYSDIAVIFYFTFGFCSTQIF